ncbi:MAG: hypothetical protein R8G34_10290 [Paracoccaceae bacterium]|nr:hypothetical protein [Paracoccaceae bacterium]
METALGHDLSLSARLTAIILDVKSLRREVLASEPATPQLPEWPEVQRGHGRSGVFVAGSAARSSISALLISVDLMRPHTAEGWENFVTSYQVLCKPDTLRTADPSRADRINQLQPVSSAVGLDLNDLRQAPGLTLKRARVPGFGESHWFRLRIDVPAGHRLPSASYCLIRRRLCPKDRGHCTEVARAIRSL